MPRKPFAPALDAMEGRLVLSTLSTPAYLGVKAAVGRILDDLGRTGDLPRATAAIARAAGRIPLSGPTLLPLWQAELPTISRAVPGSARQARRDMLLALDVHLHRGVEAGAIDLRGPASRQVSRPAVRSLDGSMTFSNNSSIPLTLTIVRRSDDRVIELQQVPRGATLHFKPSVEPEGFPPARSGYIVTIASGEAVNPRGFELAELANRRITATDGPTRGEIVIQITDVGF